MQTRSLYTQPQRFFATRRPAQLGPLSGIFKGIELVVLDIDGTVLKDTVPHYWKHMNITRAHYTEKEHWSSKECDQYFEMISEQHGASWISRRHVMAHMTEVYDEGHKMIDEAIETFYQSFASDVNTPELFPSLRELLSGLNDLAIPVLAFSDTDHFLINNMLSNHEIDHHFHRIVGETQKPQPDVLHEVLEQHPELPQTTGEHVLVIGDNLSTDGTLAKNIGGQFIYFVGGQKTLQRRQSMVNLQSKQQEGLVPKDAVLLDDFRFLCAEMNDFAAEKTVSLKC